MINSSTRPSAVIPKVRVPGCTYKADVNQIGVRPSTASVPDKTMSINQRALARNDIKSERFEDAAVYDFLPLDDDTFINIIKNENFGEEEDEIDYDMLMQFGETPENNLRSEENDIFNFRFIYDNMPQHCALNKNLREQISKTGLQRQTKDETRCIRKADEDSLRFRSLRNSTEAMGCGIRLRSRYDSRRDF